MKTISIICVIWLQAIMVYSQKIKPCDSWLTDFIQVEPKMDDGTPIEKYVVQKLTEDASVRNMATCMVGLQIYSNCHGELSYEKQDYANNPFLETKCIALLQKTEAILKSVNRLSPGTLGHQPKDFIFKLVVQVKHNGKPIAEILY